MNDLGVVDRFLDTFSRYIDSGFGLLQPEVAYLSTTLVVIDVTLAALFWAMGGEDVMPRLIKKILYVGAFAFIIGNFNWLASIIFRSFAGLGLKASGSSISKGEFLQPGRLATVGVEAAQPMMDKIGSLAGFPSVFTNIDTIAVLFIAWLIVIISFFILAVQLFVSILEFNQVGQQITRRNLNIQPTLTVRPGFPVRVIVNKDLVLRPYGARPRTAGGTP